MKHIHTLTGLRGLAVLIVFISHAANESILPGVFGKGFGQTGVMLFFVLSGFLMAHLYVNEDFNLENVKKYAFARIGRVFPLYYFLLILSIVITNFVESGSFYPFIFDKLDLAIRALFLVDAQYLFWTVPVEVQFYVVFVGFWALYKKGVNTFYLLAYVLITLTPSVIFYLKFSKVPPIIFSYSYSFFLGVITALFFEKIKSNSLIKRILPLLGFPALLLLFVNLPELRLQYGLLLSDDNYFKTWGDPVTWIVVYTTFICATLNAPGLAILKSRFFVFLGTISYGFYLIHYPVLMFFVKEVDVNPLAKLTFSFLTAALISYLSFHYFEKSIGRRIRDLAR